MTSMPWPKGMPRKMTNPAPAFDHIADILPEATSPAIPPIADEKMPTVRPFGMVDIGTHAPWLVEKLREWYPHLNQANIVGWLRMLMGNNECMFLRTDHAAGLVMIMHEPMSAVFSVREVWSVVQPGFESEAEAMLKEYFRWSKLHGATWLERSGDTDITQEQWRKAFGKVRINTLITVDIA